jgi:hypothetical protein
MRVGPTPFEFEVTGSFTPDPVVGGAKIADFRAVLSPEGATGIKP